MATTARTSTARSHVDANRSVTRVIDAEDNGSPHNGTGGLADTDDPTVAGIQRGDPTDKVFDGFDRELTVINAMGYQSAKGCSCGGGQVAYDPDNNVLATSSIGPTGGNLRGSGVNDKLLSTVHSLFDEMSRDYRREEDYFRLPQPLSAPVVESVYVCNTLYDRLRRMTRQTHPLGDYVELDHDGLNRVINRRTNPLTGPAGTLVPSEFVYSYDDADNRTQINEIERSVEDGRTETYFNDTFYDAVNRPDLRISPHFVGNTANALRIEFDSKNNPVAGIDANGSTTTTVQVDRGGLLVLTINATGNAVISVHDGLSRMVRTVREIHVDHDGALALDTSTPKNTDGLITTLQDWDANSRLASVTDDEDTSQAPGPLNPSSTTYTYDDLNRQTVQTNADGETQVTTFDKDDNTPTFTDENGSILLRTFDDLRRVIQVSITPAAGVEGTTLQTCEFDGLSRKTRCTDDNGTQVDSVIACSYDSLSRQQNCDQAIGAVAARSVTSEFDKNNNLIQLTYPGEVSGAGRRKVTYGYQDSVGQTLNRIELVEEGAGTGTGNDILPSGAAASKIADYGYVGPVRAETRSYGNGGTGMGILMTKAYDALRRNTRMQHSHADLGGAFADLEYAFDRNDNRLNEIFHHEGVSGLQDVYRYDSQGRMLREDRSAALGGIVNNQVANPTATATENRTWGGLDGANNWNAVTGAGGFPSLSTTTNEMNEYDIVDAIARIHDKNGNLTDDGTNLYVFDALNRMVRVRRKSDSLDIAFYAYDCRGRRIRRETLNPGITLYYYKGDTVVEEADAAGVPTKQYVWADALLQFKTTAFFEPIYCHENGYGSILHTTNEGLLATDGGILDAFDYNAFGEVVRTSGLFNTGLPYRFSCWRFDSEASFYLLGKGMYFSPALGRGISRGSGALFNLYALGGNNLFVGRGVSPFAGFASVLAIGGAPSLLMASSFSIMTAVEDAFGMLWGIACCQVLDHASGLGIQFGLWSAPFSHCLSHCACVVMCGSSFGSAISGMLTEYQQAAIAFVTGNKGFSDSAMQKADFADNKTGRELGEQLNKLKKKSLQNKVYNCFVGCEYLLGGRFVPEGPGTSRPFGPGASTPGPPPNIKEWKRLATQALLRDLGIPMWGF